MQRRTITLVIILFIVLVAGMFGFAYLQQQNMDSEPTQTEQVNDDTSSYAGIDRITGKHFFEDGVHTIVGEIALPTPCDLLEVNALVAESLPEQVTLDFSVINNDDACIQVVTAQRFKVSVSASEDASFNALLMNKAVILNLVPANEGESPDDFELFIKG